MGIVNGTTNYVLTRMTEDGSSFAEALAEAQGLGYAERDPTADVEGFDAAAKAAIIASIAFGARVVAGDVYREGITRAHRRRHRGRGGARLRREAARGRRGERRRGRACACTRRWCPSHHPLASVRGSFNAVFIEGEAVGQLMLSAAARAAARPRARCSATSSTRRRTSRRARGARRSARSSASRSGRSTRSESQFYVSLDVADQPGVLADDRRACSATTRCRSSRCSRRGRATTPA